MNTAQPIGSVCLYLGDLAQVSQAPNPAWSSGDGAVAASAASRTDGPLRALLEPLGWMPCDGREMRISRYPDLFAALGCLYGGQYERGIFNLPDLRGMFVRGVDDGAGADPDRDQRRCPDGNPDYSGVGSLQRDALQAHQHDYSEPTGNTVSGDAAQAWNLPAKPQKTTDPVTGRVSAHETRPRNMAVHYIIRVE